MEQKNKQSPTEAPAQGQGEPPKRCPDCYQEIQGPYHPACKGKVFPATPAPAESKCGAHSIPRGYWCTEPKGHEGDHVALRYGTNYIECRWAASQPSPGSADAKQQVVNRQVEKWLLGNITPRQALENVWDARSERLREREGK